MFISHKTHLYLRLNCYRRYTSCTKIMPKEDLPTKAYQPAVVENKHNNWEKSDLFKAKVNYSKPTFCMVLPPPNITGKLHLGHALTCTIQDVIVRRKRSLGHNVLWIPGTDHAGIATQGVVEKYLKSKRKLDRHLLGRQKFNEEVWKWKEKYGDAISQQLRTLALSLDWSRQTFTMDEKHANSVDTAFIRLFKKKLIYRKKALINWCTALKSTVSDIEIENRLIEKPTEIMLPGYDEPVTFGLIFDFAYKVYDSGEEIVVSTTMPETMLGDVAVAVHPDDDRYKHLHHKRVEHPFRNDTIPIILDTFVDMKFGTGAVKITPAHSKIDYDVAKRHNLPLLQVINEDGCMNENGKKFATLKKYRCRQAVVENLNDLGLLRKVSPHSMALPTCSRTGDIIEYLPKEQWFLNCKELNKKAREVVTNETLKIEPEKYKKNWLQWTQDERDWCISRQLWWGHQIPAYKCVSDDETVWVAAFDEDEARREAAKLLSQPSRIDVKRDSDVLDTWFSSGIYPFACLGWPDDTEDFKKFYPLNLMVTGHDILGFWVHRMVMLGLELTDQLPFHHVFLHGIICDSQGSKMSKSRGNVIDPIDVIRGISLSELNAKSEEMLKNGALTKEEFKKAKLYHKDNFSNTAGIPECGADALRFTILSQDVKSHFVNFDVAMCHANKLFCNKIWQSVKYTQLSFEKLGQLDSISREDLNYFDKWILSRLGCMVRVVNESLDDYNFHFAVKSLRAMIYNEFCDIYLESTKLGFDSGNAKVAYAHAHTLSAVLNTSLRCLAPFMVYLTEEVIPKIPGFEKNIIHNYYDSQIKLDFPKTEHFDTWIDNKLDARVENLLNAIHLIRQLKSLYGMTNKIKPLVCIQTENKSLRTDMEENASILENLTRCKEFQFKNVATNENFVSSTLTKDTSISIELIGDNIPKAVQAAKSKIGMKIKKAEESLEKLETKISSNNYLTSAPESIQFIDKQKLITKKEELQVLKRLILP